MADDRGKLVDRNVVDSSLFRTVTSLDGKTTSFVIGHRCATLIPTSHQGQWGAFPDNIDDDEITTTLKKDPPAPIRREADHAASSVIQNGLAKSRGTAAVVLPEGAAVTDNIIIFAEDLVIYRGSKFEWPCKNVTIFARRVIVAPRASETFASDSDHWITFDVSAPPANDKYVNQSTNPGAAGSKGDDGQSPGVGTEAVAGGDGTAGENGGNAASGGTIRFCARLMTLLTEQEEKSVKVCWLSKGGNGGRGQQGGAGGNGGSGVQATDTWHTPRDSCADAKKGGNGGKGGKGGNGGDGGHIELCLLKPSATAAEKTKFREVENTFDVSAGSNGSSGGGGAKGSAGSAGHIHTGLGMGDHYYGGQGASDGDAGDPGDANNSTRTPGSSHTASFGEDNVEAWALCVSPGFLQMLVQRLLFEYDVLFGSFFDVKPIKGKSAHRLRFELSLQWLVNLNDTIQRFENSPELADKPSETETNFTDDQKTQQQLIRSVFGGDLWKSSPELRAARQIYRIGYDKLFSLRGSQLPPIPSTDSYNQSFRLIPTTSFSIKRLELAAQEMEVAEARRAVLAEEIAAANWTSSQTADKVQQLSDFVASIEPRRAAAKAKVDSGLEKVKKDRDALNKRIDQAKAELQNLKPNNPLNLSCDNVVKIIESAAVCMMFTPEAAGMVLAGNVMSVGGSAMSLVTTVHTAQGNVSKDELMGKFYSIEAKLGGKELSQEIAKLSQGGEATEFMKVIVVAKSKFDALVDSHFPGDASEEARAVWDLMMKQAKATHKSLIEYQEALLKQAQVEAYFVQSQVAKATLQENTSATASIKSQLFYQVYDDSYAQQKAMVVKYYLDAIRAIVAITLEPTSLSHSLIALGCWDNVTGSLFNEVILPQLRAENDYLVSKDSRANRQTTTYSGWITKDQYPVVFGYENGPPEKPGDPPSLIKKETLKPFSFDITSTNCQKVLNINLAMECDIRMIECHVALEGAKLKEEKDMDPVISINTSFAGGFYVTTGDTETIIDGLTGESRKQDVEYMFEIDEVITGCRYQYDSKDPKSITWRTENSNPFARMVDLDDIQTVRRAVQSPFTTWNISWDEKAYDVSSVERIRLEVKCDYRPRRTVHQDTFQAMESEGADSTPFTAMGSMPTLSAIQLVSPAVRTLVTTAQPLNMRMDQVAAIHDYTDSGSGDLLTSFPPLPISPFIGLVKWPEAGGLAVNGIRLRVKNMRTFTRSSSTSRAVNGIMGWLIPTGYTQTRGLHASVRRVYDRLGESPQARIDARAKNPNSDDVIQGTKDLCQAVLDMYNSLPEDQRLGTSLGDWASEIDHSAVNASMTEIPKEVADKIGGDYAKYGEAIFLSRIKAIGVGATVLTGKHADTVRKLPYASDKIAYCWLFRTQILEDEQAWLKEGKSIKGCVVQLGNSGLIAYDDCKVIQHGDMIIIEACAYTMSWHTLYGGNSWITIFDKNNPYRVTTVNFMEGQGKIRLGEKVNCMIGEPLMLRTQIDFPVWLEAIVLGKQASDVVKTKSQEFQDGYNNARKWFAVLDLGGIGMAGYRAWKGGNAIYDHYNSIEVEAKDDVDLQEKLKGKSPEDVAKDAAGKGFSKAEPGMFIGGVLVTPNAYVLGRVSPDIYGPLTNGGLNEAQTLLARTKTQHALGLFFTMEANRTALREALVKIAKDMEADYLAKDPSLAKLSPRQLFDMIRADIVYDIKGRAAIQQLVIDSASFGQQITAELQNDQSFKDVNVYDLDMTISSVNNVEVQDRIFEADGVADTYVRNELVSSTVSRLTSADCVQMINECKAKVDAETKALVDAKAKRDAVDPTKKDEVDEAQRKVDEFERKVEDLKKDQKSYEDAEAERKDVEGVKKIKKDRERDKEKDMEKLAGK